MPDSTTQPDKLDGQSLDLLDQRLAALKALLPEAFDLDGNLVRDKLIEALKPATYEDTDDIPSFGLAWPGKQRAFAAAGVPTTAALRPCPEQSIDFDTTQNLLIEGDNLEVLKTLQRGYHGKVKMIYIDPPYNTGKDFVYPDNYGEGLDTYLQRTQQKDEDGFWTSTNSETSGRKHANWLSMMAPRLTLARNLLRDDGVIFISIDDNEVANLRMICDEVFGAENFVANVVWKHTQQSKNDERFFSRQYNYTLCIARKESDLNRFLLDRTEEDNKNYSNPDDDPKGLWRSGDVRSPHLRENLKFTVTAPCGSIVQPPDNGWRWKKETFDSKVAAGEIVFTGEPVRVIRKIYLCDQEGRTPENLWNGDVAGTTREATGQLQELFGGDSPFDTPKPTRLIQRMLQIASSKSDPDLILDFFTGSGTTGHAVMAQNAEDGGDRRYICVQLPEPLDEPVTLDDGELCETIFDLARERLKRAGKKIREEAGLNAEKLDTGIRVFKLDSSNFTAWNSEPTTSKDELFKRLEQLNEQTVPGRSETDILWEVVLKMGLPLDLHLERFEIEGATFIGVNDRTRVMSTETAIPTAAMEALLDQDIPPSELVVLDSAFEDDTARANIATLYKERKDEDGRPVCNLRVV